jgi:capsular polysaccharide biosynthesis protein
MCHRAIRTGKTSQGDSADMAVRKFSIRHVKAFVGRNLTRAFPSLRRHLTFFDTVRCMTDAGRTAILNEQQAVRIGAENQPFARTLPVAIPRQIRCSVALIELKDVTVLGPTGAIVDEKRGALLKPRGSQHITHNDFRLVPTRVVHKPPANYFNMMDLHRGHRHYFHFLFDRLPNLYYLLHRFELGRAPLTVLINADPPQFQRDIYRFLGRRFPNLRFEAVPEGERWRVGRLYHVDNHQPISRAFASAEFMDFVRSLVIAGYGLTAPVHPRRLYVSRSDAKLRRIANEAELIRMLADHDFEVVAPGTLSLRDQVALFMGAEIIIGPHGAGLANLLFAPRHARVLEILPANMLREHYFLLAMARGLSYRPSIGGPAGFLDRFAAYPAEVEASLLKLMEVPQPLQKVG